MKKEQFKQIIKEEIKSILKEASIGVGGEIGKGDDSDSRAAYAKERAWDARQKLPASARGKLEVGDVVEYDGKKWMIMFIYPDGDLDLKMQKPYRDEIPNLKIGDPRVYLEKIPQSEIK